MLQIKNNIIKLSIIYAVLSLLGIYLMYAPVINIPFYHHDIYKFADGGLIKFCSENYGHLNMLIHGRPLVAMLDCLNFKLGNNLENMSLLRFKCIVLAAFFAAIFAVWLYRKNFQFWVAILSSLAIFALPGIQTGMIMGTDALILSPLLGFISFLLIDSLPNTKTRLFWKLNLKELGIFGIAIISLLSSFLIYPAESAFYLVPVLILILFKPLAEFHNTRKILLRDSGIFLVSCGIYLVFAKITQHLLMTSDYPTNYHFDVNFLLVERFIGLIKVLPSLWNISYNSMLQAALIYSIILFGIISSYLNLRTVNFNFVTLVQASLAVVLLLILGSVIYLAQPTNMIFTRILYIFQVMSLFILIWAIKSIAKFIAKSKFLEAYTMSVAFIFIYSMIYANYIVTKSALNDHTEFSYLTNAIGKYLKHSPAQPMRRIHIVGLKSDSVDNFNGLAPRDDIYNINSTIYRQDSYFMVQAALTKLKQSNIKLYNCALDEFQLMHITEMECIKNAPINTTIVTYSRQGEAVNISPDLFVINMSSDDIYFPKHS